MTGDASFNPPGYVYILTNRAYPGICKIGCTSRHPVIRARELSNTSCPYPFTVAWSAEVADFQDVERAAHSALAGWRVSENREFFGCEIRTARLVIEQAARPWLSRRLRRTVAPRRSRGRRRNRAPSALPDFLRFCFCVSLTLLVLVEVIHPQPAAWWPPGVWRAVWFIEHIPRSRL